MAIDIQQPNYSGLVAIAGKSAPLNIQPTGVLGLQALQQAQANQAALRANALGQAQLQQQGQMGLLSNQMQSRALDLQAEQQQRQGLLSQNELGLKRAQLGMQAGQFQDELSLKQQQLGQQGAEQTGEMDLKNRMLAEETAKRQMVELMAEKKEKLQEKGAFASFALLAMTGAKTTEEASQIRTEVLKEARSKNLMSPEELKTASQMPISQFQNALKYKVMQFGQVKEYKDMLDAQKPEKTSSGTHISFNPDGTVSEISTDPTSAVKTETMKELKARELGLQQLAVIRDRFDPAQFTYAGKAGRGASALAELSKGTPGLEQVTELGAKAITGQGPEDRAKGLQVANAYLNSVEQFFNTYRKDITGAAAAEKELERLRASFINSDLSPSQFKGALDQLLSKYTSEAEFNKNVLNKGLDVSPKNEALRQHLKSLNKYSDDEINNYLRGK